jgi:hypothetical protein
MQEVRKFEYDQKLKYIRKQYAPPPAVPGLWYSPSHNT